MFNRGRSKDRGSRKATPPQASYMDNNQFANYLTELREKRVTRPGGAKTPGPSSTRTSIDPASSAARTLAATSTTTVNTTAAPPFPRADSALSNRTTTTTLSHAPTHPSMPTSRSRRSMPPPASPEPSRKSTQIDPTVLQPSATYIERGQRWMEREEAGSLRDALEDMDAAEREKALAVELAAQKLRDEQLEEEERIQMAAQQEASELVHAHLYPEEIKRRQEEEERRRMTGYRYHLRKGSYQHARAASVGREYKGEDAVIVDLNQRPGMGGRTFSDESTIRSASRTSMRRESSDHSSRPEMPNWQSTDEIRGRTPSKTDGKSYGTLSGTISGVASKSRSWSARRKSGSGKRNISGEVNTVFHPDQIWEEPETSRESSKNRKKEQDAAKAREDMSNGTVEPLSPLKRNPANRVQFAKENSADSSAENFSSSLPLQKIDRFEIFRNPPSQSRNPLYTDNRSRSPSPAKLQEVPMKDGKEIRNEELRKATTKSLKDRSEKLPTPTAVSDRLGRPIVSFDKEWAPTEEKAQNLAEQKKLADLCPPVSAARTKLVESTTGGHGKAKEHTVGGLSAIEAAKRKIFGSAAQEQVSGSIRERRASRSPQRRGRPRTSGEGQGEGGKEGGRAESQGGEKGKEEERQGYFEIAGGQADTQHELGTVGNAEAGASQTGVAAEVKVAGKWIVETKKGMSTFRIEDEKTLKEQQARKDGFPYRLDKLSANSSTNSIPLAADLRPTSKHGSHHSAPRTSISHEKLEADIDTTPVATPLASLHKALPVPPAEPAKEPTKPTRGIVSIAPPNPMDRTSTLMARSPFARPRGESFISRRSIFQPEKSVPASPVRADSGSSLKSIDNDKPRPLAPFTPSLLSAPRPRPSFLTRTRSRSSVSGHSVFALKKPEPAAAPAEPAKAKTPPPITEDVPSPPNHASQEKTSTESLRPSITRDRSSESSVSKALPSLPPTSSNEEKEPFPAVDAPSRQAVKMTPFRPSLLSAARPRPSLLTRTRSRSLMSGHSVFTLKKTNSTSASPLNDDPKPGLEIAAPAPPAHTSHGKGSTEEKRPSISRSRSSDGSISKALPSLPATSSHQPQEALPKAEAPAVKPAVKMTPFGPSLLSASRPRPSFLTRTRSRSSVAGHSVFALKKPEPAQASSPPLAAPAVREAKPEGEEAAPPPPAHVPQEHTSIEEIRPLFIRAKSSEASISRPLPTPPPIPVEDLPQPAAPTVSPPPPSTPAQVAEAPKPASHITNSHLSAARSRPSFLTRTRSRSSVAGHSRYSLKGEESSSPLESSSPAPLPRDEDRPPFARSKSSENDIPKTTPRQSLDGPPERNFAPRSPFARPSLGPTSLSTPQEFSLNKQGSVASRSPFGRPGGARSSMSTVSVPSRLTEIGPSPSVRKSPFDRPKTRDGTTTPHTRSSLGMEARRSIDENERPESRQSFSNTLAKAKLPWMRNKSVPGIDAAELSRPRSATVESFRLDSPLERPVSREKELPWMEHSHTEPIPMPQKIMADEPVKESPPAIEVTVNTADVAALYRDVMESPTKAASEVVVNTAEIAEQYNLVLNESKQLDEKAGVSAPVPPLAVEKKSSLSGARPLPMRPSGPRQSAPSVRRAPRELSRPPPAVENAETVPESVMPPPPTVAEPPKERPGHEKSTSISAPSTHASVLAPPTETLSEVRPPAPEENEVKPLPTIYGPPRTDTPPGFPPSLNIQAPSIAIRAPSPAPPDNGPTISVSAPAINISGPAINEPSAPAPPRQQPARPLPHPTRPLPQPGSSARPLPRPGSSSGHRPSSSHSSHRPLPAPANARPIPHPSSRVAPPPNLARPSSDSTSHWSPAPVPAGGRATATCHACNLPIEGRVIALAGLKERWHPACMQCHVCSTALADFEISPEPAFSRAARIARIEARENGDYVAEGESTDGDRKLRFYCHLDWHEAFAPRCQTCKTPIIGEHITALGGKHYHYGHFFCCECGDPFMQGVPHVELEGYAWCTGCMEKRTERRAPRCGLCRKNVVGEVVKALGKEFHAECFRCGDCQRGFVDGEIYLRDDVGVSCRECMERWAKNGGR